MLNKPAYRVFISTTTKDLEEVRHKIALQILNAGHIPLSMESWPSSTTKTLDVLRDEIESCDIFVTILGARYGSLIEDSEVDKQMISYAEFEFDRAMQLNRPTLAFLLRDKEFDQQRSQLPNGDSERECDKLIANFRKKLRQTRGGDQRIVRGFTDENDLLPIFVHSLNALIQMPTFKSPGLLPADTLIPPSPLQILERTPFLKPVLNELKGYKLLFNRVQEREELKRHLANFFWHYCFPGINKAKAYRLFFESGSTVAYLADSFLLQTTENKSWTGYLPKVQIMTNNILVYLQFLFTSPTLTAELRPQGKPDKKYGATYGIIDYLSSVDPPNDEPLDDDADSAAVSMAKHLTAPSISSVGSDESSQKILILAAASGVTSTGIHIGPHVGSYRNKILKRALLLTKSPIVFFIDESKVLDIEKAFNEMKCFPLCGQQLPWDKICKSQPIAFCSCTSNAHNRLHVAESLHALGMTMSSPREPRGDYEGCLPFLVANSVFAQEFPGIPLRPIEQSGLLNR
ncbi:MAG: DUF4062 domain-containing protein [Nitrospira sp.]|nr:DUF4062 domain-containing protein [Nitrospira sp.]